LIGPFSAPRRKFMRRPALFLLLLFFTSALQAQTPTLAWQKCFGGPYLDDGASIEPTSDGGYIMTGEAGGPGGDVTGYHGNVQVGDYWVVKMDNTGTIQWERTLGGFSFDGGSIVHQTPDGGYIVGGQSATPAGDGDVTSANHGGSDFWVVKLSSTGAIQWQNSYGGEQNEYLYGLDFTPDGGYILAGTTLSTSGQVTGQHGGANDIWVVKLSSTGAFQWQKCLGGSDDDEAFDVKAYSDGTYVVAGYTYSQDGDVTGNHGGRDMWVVKLDNGGAILWAKCLGGTGVDQAWGVVAMADGGCVAAGSTTSNDGNVTGNHGAADIWVVRLDNTGALQWQKCYGGSNSEIAYSMSATPDGGYLVAGSTTSTDGDVTCFNTNSHLMGWVFKIDGTGVLQWQTVLGGNYFDEEHSIKPTSDGGAIVGGYTGSPDLPGYHPDVTSSIGDFYAAKLSPPPVVTINVPTGILCAGTPFTFTATVTNAPSLFDYQWIKSGVNQMVNTSTYSTTNLANGDQVFCRIIVYGACGPTPVSSNIVTLNVSPQPAPAISIIGFGGPICPGTPVTFTASVSNAGGMPVYQWQDNGNPVGTNSPSYTSTTLADGDLIACVYSDNTACVVPAPNISNTLTEQVLPAVFPSISITASEIAVCDGSTVTFTAKMSGGGATPSYQWEIDGQPVGTDAPSFASSTLTDGEVVSCVLTSDAVCASPGFAVSNPVPISVDPVVVSAVSVGYSPGAVCAGEPVVFTATPTNEGPKPVYQWAVNGAAVGTNAPTFSSRTLVGGDVVSCGLSDVIGCVIPSTANVTPVINPLPVVGVSPVLLVNRGGSVTLDLPVTGDIADYSWTPAAGLSDALAASPVATPVASIVYTLTVTTTAGCVDSGHLTVKVLSQVSIPGAFSPNGDGKNDVFYVIGGPLGSLIKDMVVFDRWGQKVFQVHDVPTDDPAFGWDGRVRGQVVSPGAYVYELLMRFADGTQQVYKGTVMVVR
jgi:gliding motility-associated-like protein